MGRMAHKAPDYLAVNPNGELPAIRHGDRVLYDSQLIAEYLDHIYRANPLYPDDAYLRAQVRMWLALEAGTHKECRPLFYLHVIRPELLHAGLGAADVDRIVPAGVHPSFQHWLRDTLNGTPRFDTSEELARAIILKKLDVLEDRLAGRQHLVGERFTMADAGWFTRVDSLPALRVTLPPERYPNIQHWCGRVAERPSVVASVRN